VLIADKNEIDEEFVINLSKKIAHLSYEEQNYVSDWLLANQLTKSKRTIKMISEWQSHNMSFMRRLFWYYQARLRWTGKTDFDNTNELVELVENKLIDENENVQWAMNFCAAWIAIHDTTYRDRISKIGEKVGLYKEEKLPKNCTPNYLLEFIKTEVNKQNK
jgi:3-methyladenine DNA glycosylase AlkD